MIFTEKELKNKLLSQEKICSLYDQIETSAMNNYEAINEIKFIIEDYNKIIMSFIYFLEGQNKEKESFEDDNNLFKGYSTDLGRNHNSEKNIVSQLPKNLRNTKGKMDKNKSYENSLLRNSNNQSDESNCFQNPELIVPNSDLMKIKITNDILRDIEITVSHQKFFSIKYSDISSYENFVDNLINYRFDFNILIDIRNDIIRFKQYKPKHVSSPKKVVKEENAYDFDKSLRVYENDIKNNLENKNRPPFYKFTPVYGDYFDKNTKHISSPIRHKRDFE